MENGGLETGGKPSGESRGRWAGNGAREGDFLTKESKEDAEKPGFLTAKDAKYTK